MSEPADYNLTHDMDGDTEDDVQFVHPDDVLEEIAVGGDDNQPMDEDDDDETLDIAIEDNSIQQFRDHGSSVFAVCVHPTQPIAASGGEDDLGYLWNIQTGELLVKLTGHTDSVTSTAFSIDGELIATGSMDGRVRLWRRVGKESWKIWEFLAELQGPDEVMWLRWHPRGYILLAGSNDGTVWLWQLPSGNTMQVFAGHSAPVQCGQFTPDGKRIITADASGTLIFWDPRSPTPVFKLTSDDARFSFSKGDDDDDIGITSLSVNPASALAVVGGAAGGVRVVSLSKGDVVGALIDGHKTDGSIEAAQFVDLTGSGSGVVVTGGTDGRACIWDLDTMRLRATLEHDDAITTLLPHSAPHSYLITSASADRTLRTWDARTGKLLKEHKGHHGPVLAAALNGEASHVVSAGDDGVCLVFSTTE